MHSYFHHDAKQIPYIKLDLVPIASVHSFGKVSISFEKISSLQRGVFNGYFLLSNQDFDFKEEHIQSDSFSTLLNAFAPYLDPGFTEKWPRRKSLKDAFHCFPLSVFQKKVFQQLHEIKWAQIDSYASLAKRLSSHPRAISRALATNPYPILFPCHRVVPLSSLRTSGRMAGYGGYRCGGVMKRKLIEFEKMSFKGR